MIKPESMNDDLKKISEQWNHVNFKMITLSGEWEVPRWVVPVVFAEAPIAERIVLPPTSGGCGDAWLLDAAPLVGVEGDTCCLVTVGACRVQQQESGRQKGQPNDSGRRG